MSARAMWLERLPRWVVDLVLPRAHLKLPSASYTCPLLQINGTARALARNREYEPWLYHVLEVILSVRNGTVIDVGANVGQTLLTVLRIDRERPYLGFEPQVSCCAGIERFIAENNLSSHVVFALALADHGGCLALHNRGIHDLSASLVEQYRPKGFHHAAVQVPTARGDDVLRSLGVDEVAIIKIDVEGGELNVLRGLRSTLEEKRPPVVFELLPDYLVITKQPLDEETRAFRETVRKEIVSLFREERYDVFYIDGTTLSGPASMLIPDPRRILNCIGVPREDTASFRRLFAVEVDDESDASASLSYRPESPL